MLFKKSDYYSAHPALNFKRGESSMSKKFKKTSLYNFIMTPSQHDEGPDVFEIDLSFLERHFSARGLVQVEDDSIFGCDEENTVAYAAKIYSFCGLDIETTVVTPMGVVTYCLLLNEAIRKAIIQEEGWLENDYIEHAYCNGENPSSEAMNKFIKRRLTKNLRKRFRQPLVIRRFDDNDWK